MIIEQILSRLVPFGFSVGSLEYNAHTHSIEKSLESDTGGVREFTPRIFMLLPDYTANQTLVMEVDYTVHPEGGNVSFFWKYWVCYSNVCEEIPNCCMADSVTWVGNISCNYEKSPKKSEITFHNMDLSSTLKDTLVHVLSNYNLVDIAFLYFVNSKQCLYHTLLGMLQARLHRDYREHLDRGDDSFSDEGWDLFTSYTIHSI